MEDRYSGLNARLLCVGLGLMPIVALLATELPLAGCFFHELLR